MFNRSEILRSAWAAYRLARMGYGYSNRGNVNGKATFLRDMFAKSLRTAWAEAKSVGVTAAAFVTAQARVQTAAAAAMDPMARSARIAAIRDELQVLDYAPFGVRTGQRRQNLGAELATLANAAA